MMEDFEDSLVSSLEVYCARVFSVLVGRQELRDTVERKLVVLMAAEVGRG